MPNAYRPDDENNYNNNSLRDIHWRNKIHNNSKKKKNEWCHAVAILQFSCTAHLLSKKKRCSISRTTTKMASSTRRKRQGSKQPPRQQQVILCMLLWLLGTTLSTVLLLVVEPAAAVVLDNSRQTSARQRHLDAPDRLEENYNSNRNSNSNGTNNYNSLDSSSSSSENGIHNFAPISCRITIQDTLSSADNADTTTTGNAFQKQQQQQEDQQSDETVYLCIPLTADQTTETDQIYPLYNIKSLLQTFNESDWRNLLFQGRFYVEISLARIVNLSARDSGFAEDLIVQVSDEATIQILPESKTILSTKSLFRAGNNVPARNPSSSSSSPPATIFNVIGNYSVAVIHVSVADAAPKFTVEQIRDHYFGPNKTHFRAQYAACSFRKLFLYRSPIGVYPVRLNQPLAAYSSISAIVGQAQAVVTQQLNLMSITQLADYIMFCVPANEEAKWTGSASLHTWRSQYAGDWCLSLSGNMHELGHNLGLLHANMDGRAYADQSSYMAAAHRTQTWPRKCFNGFQHWQLGWYRDRTITVHPLQDLAAGATLIPLVAFVDYDRITAQVDPAFVVIINIANKYYLQYNRAKRFNSENEAKRNTVTVTHDAPSGTQSLAGLDVGDVFRDYDLKDSAGRVLVVQVCSRSSGYPSIISADIMVVSIGMGSSVCSTASVLNKMWTGAESSSNTDPTLDEPNPTEMSTPNLATTPTTKPTPNPINKPTTVKATPTRSPTTLRPAVTTSGGAQGNLQQAAESQQSEHRSFAMAGYPSSLWLCWCLVGIVAVFVWP